MPASSARPIATATSASTLPAYIAMRAGAAGIGSFTDLGLCTYADADRFYSYRRMTHRSETDYGRLLHAIALVDDEN